MPTTADCVQVALEETPRYEGAVTTTPLQVSTTVRYMPIQGVSMAPGVAHLDRSDELRGIEGAVDQLVDGYDVAGSLQNRAYPNDLTWLLTLCGMKATYTAGGALITDGNATTANGVNGLNSGTVNVASTAGFDAIGSFILGGVATAYTGKTATSFTGCGNHAATTGGEAITGNAPATTNKWVFSKRTGLNAKTAQLLLCYLANNVFIKAQGVGCSSLSFASEGGLQAALSALVYARIADPNLTPAFDTQAIPPFRRGDMTVDWLSSSGTTQDFNWQINNPLVKRRTFAVSSYFPDVHEQGDEKVSLTGSIAKSTLATADIDALLAGTTFAAKIRYTSPTSILATNAKYKMLVELPRMQLLAGSPDDIGNKRRFGGSYDFRAAWDETAGYDFRITLINSVTTMTAGSPDVGL